MLKQAKNINRGDQYQGTVFALVLVTHSHKQLTMLLHHPSQSISRLCCVPVWQVASLAQKVYFSSFIVSTPKLAKDPQNGGLVEFQKQWEH